MLIRIGYSLNSWKNGVKTPLFWNTDAIPHILLSGITGGGKTILAQTIVNQLLTEHKSIYICDFKAGGDWNGIIPNYAEYKDCDRLLDDFYSLFVDTIEQKKQVRTVSCF